MRGLKLGKEYQKYAVRRTMLVLEVGEDSHRRYSGCYAKMERKMTHPIAHDPGPNRV